MRLPVFDDFGSREELAASFRIQLDELEELEILYAWYDSDGYSGRAHVVVRAGQGQLFECESSHCSCSGLDWDLTPTTLGALKMYETDNYTRPGWDQLITYLEHENNGN